MKPTFLPEISAVTLCAALLLPASLTAQQQGDEHRHKGGRHRYKLVDLGTFGGPISYGEVNGVGGRLLNDKGVVSSSADFATPDPNAPDLCFADCLLVHAAKWRHHKPIDLGALDNSYSSTAGSINDLGWSTGQSQTGLIVSVPIFPNGIPQLHAVLWRGRSILDLDTLPGGRFSVGISVNNAGQVVGFSDNDIPDPFAMFPTGTQTRTFLWQDGNMEDIGTLGGPDSIASAPGCDNQRPGVIVGTSYTSFTPNASSGIPTQDPFLWDNGTMTDLGNLGGTVSLGQCANNRGEVIGQSNLPGDKTFHAFRWRNGKMKDLGTLGGPDSEAIWINDEGEIAGSADLPTPGIHDAVIWRHGHVHDLGTLPGEPCSHAYAINSRGQVVGGSSDCKAFLHAFVWEEGGPMRDLNKLIRPGSGLQITNAFNINGRGEILAKSFPIGTTPSDDADLGHLVLLIPCDRDDHEGECEDHDGPAPDDDAVASPVSAPVTTHAAVVPHSQHSLTAEDGASGWRTRIDRRLVVPKAPEH